METTLDTPFRAPPGRLLRRGLLANAAFSTFCAAALLIVPDAVASAMGLPASWIFRAVGAGLLLGAADFAHQATRERLDPRRALATIAADIAWVVGTIVALAGWSDALSPLGIEMVAGVGLIVAGFATAQAVGLRRACA